MPTSAQDGMMTIEKFISEITTKTADDGKTPLSEPGSQGGPTSHPVKKVDDRLEKAPEGERFKENTKDVKEDQGAPSVENAAEAKAGNDARNIFNLISKQAAGQTNGVQKAEGVKKAEGAVMTAGSAADDHMQIGTKVSPTGEDPKSETSSAKAGKNDPGSTHPARTDNDKIDGHKWSFDTNTPLEKMASMMEVVGNNLMAKLAHHCQQQGVVTPAASGQTKQADIDPYLAQQAGWELAGLINGTFDKKAADSMVYNTLVEIVKTASDDADRYVQCMDSFLRKQAEGMPPPPPPDAMAGGPPPGAGGPPPPGGPPGAPPGAPPGETEAPMMAALGGGGAPPGAGGPPPGGPPDQEAIQLAQILESLGITKETLEQALAQEGGGPPGAGGPPPGMGGPPPEGGGGPPPGMEAAAGDRGFAKQAAYAGTGQGAQKNAQADKSAHMKDYITELLSRSRQPAANR